MPTPATVDKLESRAAAALERADYYVNDGADYSGKGDVRAVYFALVAVAETLQAIRLELTRMIESRPL